jgi:outer membrane protein OmpA-like peptidoglycan-associated protein
MGGIMKTASLASMLCASLLMSACSTTNKNVKMDPKVKSEITEYKEQTNIKENRGEHLLAPDAWEEVQELQQEIVEKAREGALYSEMQDLISKRDKAMENFREKVSFAKTHLAELLVARDEALSHGAYGLETFKEADEEFSELSESVQEKDLNEMIGERGEIIKMYKEAKVEAIQNSELRVATTDYHMALELDADDFFEKQTEETKKAMDRAKELISEYPDSQKYYKDAVRTAGVKAANLLSLTQTAKWIDEKPAAEISTKLHSDMNRVLSNYSYVNPELYSWNSKVQIVENESEFMPHLVGELSDAQWKASIRAHELDKMEKTNSKLKSQLEREKELDENMQKVASLFTKEEAEVYRKGDEIVVKLIGLNFAFNKANLPNNAEKLLKKVSKATEILKPEEVKVIGRSDSVGDALYNQKLSQKRAQNVSEFLRKQTDISSDDLEVMGVGFQRPYAENKTKQGRAMNRSVDIVFETSGS